MDHVEPFVVDVSLSPAAAKELARLKEGISILVVWSFEQTKANRRYVRDGESAIGSEEVRISGAGGRAQISGKGVDFKNRKWLQQSRILFDINVFSSRLSSEYNLLDCEFVSEPVTVGHPPVPIFCKLIKEI